MKTENIVKEFGDSFSLKGVRKGLIFGVVIFCILISLSLISSESASAKIVPKTTQNLTDEADVIVNGTVVSIENNIAGYPRIRRITVNVTSIIKGSPADTIYIIQLRPADDPTRIYPHDAVFSVNEDIRVYLINISDNFLYDWDGVTLIPIPPGTNYWVHQGYYGKEPFQIPRSYSAYSNSSKKCCILLDFAADAFDDKTIGVGEDLIFTAAQKTAINNKVIDKVKADYNIPDCPITVTTNAADCAGSTFQVTVKIGGNAPMIKLNSRTTDDYFGYAQDSALGNGCVTGKNVYVYTQEFGFEDGKKNWADTVDEMAQAIANVAAHEVGHQFGLSHDKDNDPPGDCYKNDDRPDDQIMVDGQNDISKLGTVDQLFTAGDINKIKECCCPSKIESKIESCDKKKKFCDIFKPDEVVYVKGMKLKADEKGDIYVVDDQIWTDGMDIKNIKQGAPDNYCRENDEEAQADDDFKNSPIELGKVSNDPGQGNIPYPGKYDIVYDVDQDKKYDSNVDLVDKVTCTGFETIPEFATIAIPVAAILGLVFLFSRRKRKE